MALSSIWVPLFAALSVVAQPAPSTDDLWDLSRGAVITGQSPLFACGAVTFDARDILGGRFSPACATESPGVTLFADGKTNGFVHFVEWAMPSPVTVRSFNLWATDDHGKPTTQTLREIAGFRLLAKSSGSSTYDLVLHTFTPSHPYTFIDNVYGLLISTDIKPGTAREFRAEFINYAQPPSPCSPTGCDGPRIIELDGFANFIGPRASIRVSEAEVSWQSVSGLSYQVEYCEDVPGGNWTGLDSPIVGTGSAMRVTDKVAPGAPRRFYRVRAIE